MRWRRFLTAMVVVVTLIVVAAWFAYPYAVAAVLQSRLPQTLVSGVVVEQAFGSGAPEVAIALTVPRGRVVAGLANNGIAVPGWLIRPGLAVSGRWTEADVQADFPWSVTIVNTGAPHCELALPADWVNAVLAAQSRSGSIDGLTWSYQFDPGSRANLIEPPIVSEQRIDWRFAITASGFVSATLNEQTARERVDQLTGEIRLTATRAAKGWSCMGDATITTCEHHALSSESALLSMMAVNLGKVIELVVDEELSAEQLAGFVLPADYPVDLEMNLVLTDAPLPGAGSAKDARPTTTHSEAPTASHPTL